MAVEKPMRRIVIEYRDKGDDGLDVRSDFRPKDVDDFIAGDQAILASIGQHYFDEYGMLPEFETEILPKSVEIAARLITASAIRFLHGKNKTCLCEKCKNKLH
jgi:hypothetical protein